MEGPPWPPGSDLTALPRPEGQVLVPFRNVSDGRRGLAPRGLIAPGPHGPMQQRAVEALCFLDFLLPSAVGRDLILSRLMGSAAHRSGTIGISGTKCKSWKGRRIRDFEEEKQEINKIL